MAMSLVAEADPAPSPHSSPLMLGAYISIFVTLATILFVCAIYSCLGVSDCAHWDPCMSDPCVVPWNSLTLLPLPIGPYLSTFHHLEYA